MCYLAFPIKECTLATKALAISMLLQYTNLKVVKISFKQDFDTKRSLFYS